MTDTFGECAPFDTGPAGAGGRFRASGHCNRYLQGCPCGFYGDSLRPCTCPRSLVEKYLQRISGPLLDRIDLHVEVPRLRHDEMTAPPAGESSCIVRERVERARQVQRERFCPGEGEGRGYCNAHLTSRQIQHHCRLDGDARTLLSAAITSMHLSARAYDRILKVARTIADLAAEEQIGVVHIAEAVQYRALDRKLWG